MAQKKEWLSRRQRVLNAAEHKPLDRYPIDLGAHFSTGISVFAYHHLREYLGLDTSDIEAIDNVQLLARVDDDVLERFHIDTELLRPAWVKPTRWRPRDGYAFWYPKSLDLTEKDGIWVASRGNQRMKMPKDGFFFDGDWLTAYEPDFDGFLQATAKEAERIYKETDYFTIYTGFYAFFGGLDFACDMLTDPDEIRERNERDLQNELAHAAKLIGLCGETVGAVALNSDLGMQSGTMCSPESYADLVAPYVKRLCDFIHQNSNYKTFLHSCGSVEPLIPILIDAGIDILNPVQISAAGMEPAALKQKYGGKICFWGGGCDTQRVLGNAAPEKVREHVKEITDVMKRGGGFVFNQVHNVMGNVPPENVAAMLDAAYENSFY